ncbi:hypothetical protein GCM10009817_21000 [Terrabacter lapilli]|uniref:Lipoprotein n=1 Tax=Terrabacter lapilli TaxID=436231 RepID=A0ABP5DGX3_9MICO
MPKMRHVALLLSSLAAVVGMSSGCGATQAAGSTWPTAAGPTASATPAHTSRPSPPTASRSSPSASAVARLSREPGPDLWHDHSPAGAEAYVEDYLTRLNAAWTTPKASLLDNRATNACGTCTNFRDAAAHLARVGQRHEDPMLTVSDVSLVVWRSGVRVTADTRQTDHDIVDRSGHTVRKVEGGRAFLYVELTYRGRWWITGVGIDPVNDDGTHRER